MRFCRIIERVAFGIRFYRPLSYREIRSRPFLATPLNKIAVNTKLIARITCCRGEAPRLQRNDVQPDNS